MVFIIEKRAPLSKKVNKFMIDYVACLEQIDIMKNSSNLHVTTTVYFL